MKVTELVIGSLLGLVVVLGGLLWMRPAYQLQPSKTEVVEVIREPEVQPYWTVYGLPTYWPFYLSPYWYYDVPWGGPIQGARGYGGWDRRGKYAPHGSRPGYTGVSVGGGGGGGGGGHGGH